MSTNISLQSKQALFQASDSYPIEQPYYPLYVRLLDSKITSIALDIIRVTACIGAVGIALGSFVLGGIPAIPIVLVASLIGVFILNTHISHYFKKYYDKDRLEAYRADAKNLCDTACYLDSRFFDTSASEKSSLIKKRLLRPLDRLIAKHYSLENILRYDVVSKEQFKQALDLQVKYMSSDESLDLYASVVEACKRVGKQASLYVGENQQWLDKIKQDYESKKELFNRPEFLSYDEFMEMQGEMKRQATVLQKALKLDLIPQAKRPMAADLQRQYEQQRKRYEKEVKKSHALLDFLGNRRKAFKDSFEVSFANHRLHEKIDGEQQTFLKAIEIIRQEEVRDIEHIRKEDQVHKAPIEGRNPERALAHFTEEDKKLWESFHNTSERKVTDIKAASNVKMDRYLNSRISSYFLDMRKELEEYAVKLKGAQEAQMRLLEDKYGSLDVLKADFINSSVSARKHHDQLKELHTTLDPLFSL